MPGLVRKRLNFDTFLTENWHIYRSSQSNTFELPDIFFIFCAHIFAVERILKT